MAARSAKRPAAPPPARRASAAWPAALAAAGLAVLAYANSLGNGFVWDDPIILARQLPVFDSIGAVLMPPRDIPQFSPDYYRPLTIATYLLDRAAGGGAPFAFHLSVVLAHAATSALVCLLALQLLPPGPAARAGALVAGVLFAVHPIHTESVAWAAGRSDVLATLFVVAGLLLHGREPWSWRDSALSGLCAAAALGAKETGVALYPLMLARDVLLPRAGRAPRAWLRGYAGVAAAGLVYVALRRAALGEMVGTASDDLRIEHAPLDLVAALGAYAGELLWPLPLNAYIDQVPSGPLPLALGALVPLAGLWLAWHWWRTRRDGMALFAVGWIGLTLVPSLTIIWKIADAPLAERYLYMPSVGFCLLAGDLARRAWDAAARRRRRPILAAALAVPLLCAGLVTAARNPVWHDDVSLWEDTEPKSQASGMAARGLGTAYQQAGRPSEARAAFERALQRRNSPRGLQTIHNNLGTLAMYDGDYDGARQHYETALAVNPNAPDALFNLGLAILQGGRRSPAAAQQALAYYRRAQALNPHDPDIEAALAQAYELLGDQAAAAQHARRALDLGARGATADSLRALLPASR